MYYVKVFHMMLLPSCTASRYNLSPFALDHILDASACQRSGNQMLRSFNYACMRCCACCIA